MITPESRVEIIDNSGGLYGKCIKVLGGSLKKNGHIGDYIVISIWKKMHWNNLIEKKVSLALIVSVWKKFFRKNGVQYFLNSNNVVLMTDFKNPLGNWINGLLPIELWKKNLLKLLNLVNIII